MTKWRGLGVSRSWENEIQDEDSPCPGAPLKSAWDVRFLCKEVRAKQTPLGTLKGILTGVMILRSLIESLLTKSTEPPSSARGSTFLLACWSNIIQYTTRILYYSTNSDVRPDAQSRRTDFDVTP